MNSVILKKLKYYFVARKSSKIPLLAGFRPLSEGRTFGVLTKQVLLPAIELSFFNVEN
jgi:hypothetical protein